MQKKSEPDTSTQIRAAPEETESSSTDEQDLEVESSNDEEHNQDPADYDQVNAQEYEIAADQEDDAEVAQEGEAEVARTPKVDQTHPMRRSRRNRKKLDYNY